ncbi:hypothetical protein Pelo_1377 [Pelomyxa schiedti]|nr:hypothetical protein Pelo_1377 [Pelomyxa schiedti]
MRNEAWVGWPSVIPIKDHIDAQHQFVALAAGVIVGRCGRDIGSPVSVLTPASLSIIGRDWIVFPSRHVVVGLRCCGPGDDSSSHKYVKFSMSPTLGLVTHPSVIDRCGVGGANFFWGWIGPVSSPRDRFALVVAFKDTMLGTVALTVFDTHGKTADLELTRSFTTLTGMNRRWLVGDMYCEETDSSTMSLWNFDSIENGGVAAVENLALPWEVRRAAIDGDHSLVVLSSGGRAMVIDLEATLAQRTLVGSVPSYNLSRGIECINELFWWKGMTWAFVQGSTSGLLDSTCALLCLTTGEWFSLPPAPVSQKEMLYCHYWFHHFGGPYFVLSNSIGFYSVEGVIRVCSMIEPSRVLCSFEMHRPPEMVVHDNELIVRDPSDHDPRPKHIEIIDAVTGSLVMKMEVRGGHNQTSSYGNMKKRRRVRCSSREFPIKDHIEARHQLISFGAGVIVGRCGRDIGIPVSMLTPASLSIIGRDWVVFPARNVVVDLETRSGGTHKYVKFSVSPTLGLVARPAAIDCRGIRSTNLFCGWIGSSSSRPRFALVGSDGGSTSLSIDSPSPMTLSVIDTHGKIADMRLTDSLDVRGTWRASRRWAVAEMTGGGGEVDTSTMSLWNFDCVESGSVTGVDNLVMPWKVREAAFDGEEALIVTSFDGVFMAIDLEATLAQRALVGKLASYHLEEREYTKSLFCWKGRTWTFLSDNAGVLCLTTGKRDPLPGEGGANPIGGPYYNLSTCGRRGALCKVCSVLEPKVLRSYRTHCRTDVARYGQELIIRDPRASDPQPKYIEVVDAVSGFIILMMEIRGFSVYGVS